MANTYTSDGGGKGKWQQTYSSGWKEAASKPQPGVNKRRSGKWHPTYSSGWKEVASRPQPSRVTKHPRSDDWTTWIESSQPQTINVGSPYQRFAGKLNNEPVSLPSNNAPQNYEEKPDYVPASRKRNIVGKLYASGSPLNAYPLHSGMKASNAHSAGGKQPGVRFTDKYTKALKKVKDEKGQRNR